MTIPELVAAGMIPAANFITDFWNDQLVAHDRQWLFLVLARVRGLVRLHPDVAPG